MSEFCKMLDAFVDGELDPVETENFRHHLTKCSGCAVRLEETLQLELRTMSTFPGPREVPRTPARPRWRRMLLPSVSAAAAAAASLLFFNLSAPSALDEDWFSQTAGRRLEARVSYGPADHYRPYEPLRSAGSSVEALPLQRLAQLEERDELQGIAAIYILHENLSQADTLLTHQSSSPDRDNDLAVVALKRGALHEAYALLERVLAARPEHPQALWNRGLVLRELGLTRLAEETFERVAALREPGWSDEARSLVTTLRQQREGRATAHKAAVAALLERLSTPGAPLPLAEARQQPELVRVALYEALRIAPTRARAVALRPLAEELDRLEGGTLLRELVDSVAARDFTRRAPLARAYAFVLREQHPDPAALREQLRLAGERDILLGALLRARDARVDLDELTTLAQEARDPRFRLQVEREHARREALEGRTADAERRLVSALRACRALLPRGGCVAEE